MVLATLVYSLPPHDLLTILSVEVTFIEYIKVRLLLLHVLKLAQKGVGDGFYRT